MPAKGLHNPLLPDKQCTAHRQGAYSHYLDRIPQSKCKLQLQLAVQGRQHKLRFTPKSVHGDNKKRSLGDH